MKKEKKISILKFFISSIANNLLWLNINIIKLNEI